MKSQTLKIDNLLRIATKPDGTKIPVIDGKYSFLIQPNKDDIEKGVRGDHANCMYSRACQRLYNSELVWVTRTVAYVELKNKKGQPELQRFILKDPAKDQVAGFDHGGDYATEEAVIFAKPEPHETLDAAELTNEKHAARVKAGTVKHRNNPKSKRSAYVKGQRLEPLFKTLRAPATGMFHFRRKQQKSKI